MIVNTAVSLLVLAGVGLLAVLISSALRLPRPLVLLTSGLLLQVLSSQQAIVLTPNAFVLPFVVLGVVFAAVDHSVQAKVKEWTAFMHGVVQFTLIRAGLIVVFFVLAAVLFKQGTSTGVAAGIGVLGALVLLSGAPELFKHEIRSHAARVLVHTDAVVSSVIGMAVPVLFVTARTMESGPEVVTWVLGVSAALGTGLFLGILFYRLLRAAAEEWARLGLFIIALLSYAIAEQFFAGGGVLACLALGLFLANVHLPHRLVHGPVLSSIVEGAVFLLLGLLVPSTIEAWLIAVVFVALLVLARFFAMELCLSGHFTTREKLLLSMNNPIGLPSAATTLALTVAAPYAAYVSFLTFVPGVILITLVLHTWVYT